MDACYLALLAVAAFVVLAYRGKGYWAWVSASILLLLAWWQDGVVSITLFKAVFFVFVAADVVFGIPGFRRHLISGLIMKIMAKALPKISETEDTALKAGTVWWEGELFSGKPDWKKLLGFKVKPLSTEEQAFLDGPVKTDAGKVIAQ